MRGRAASVLDDRPCRFLEELLAKKADASSFRVRDRATIRGVETSPDPQQRRLSGAVRTDQTNAVAVGDAERNVLQDLARAEPARDGLDRQHAHVWASGGSTPGPMTCQCMCGLTPGAAALARTKKPALSSPRLRAASWIALIIDDNSAPSRASGDSRDATCALGMTTTWIGAPGSGWWNASTRSSSKTTDTSSEPDSTSPQYQSRFFPWASRYRDLSNCGIRS